MQTVIAAYIYHTQVLTHPGKAHCDFHLGNALIYHVEKPQGEYGYWKYIIGTGFERKTFAVPNMGYYVVAYDFARTG